MSADVAFLIGLLDEPGQAGVSRDDFLGPHGGILATWQKRGFISNEPAAHPAPSCPHCQEGVPHLLGDRLVCNVCWSRVDEDHLQLWPLNTEAFFCWLAEFWGLLGGVRYIEENLCHLGGRETNEGLVEVFFRRAGSLSDLGRRTLEARRHAIVLFGRLPPREVERVGQRRISLLDVLLDAEELRLREFEAIRNDPANVQFDAASGALHWGNRLAGEVPCGSREFFFLDCLAANLDHFVSYADLKRAVLRRTGGHDDTEEATFCHGLKRRLKTKFIAEIDQLLTTTNKGDGYRLRARAEA